MTKLRIIVAIISVILLIALIVFVRSLRGPGVPADEGSNLRPASSEALRVVALIADAGGFEPNFIVREADFENSPIAYAAVRKIDGEYGRVIVYDGARFQWADGVVNWYEIAIMAHEIGHHVGGHVLVNNRPQHDQELEADRFAGFIVAKLGGTMEQAHRMTQMFSILETEVHPGRLERMRAVEEGWLLGKQAFCAPSWVSPPHLSGGRTCRLALRCGERGPVLARACRGPDGAWTWGE